METKLYTITDNVTGSTHSYTTREQARDARAEMVYMAALDGYAECHAHEKYYAEDRAPGRPRMMIHLRALDRAREAAEARYSCVTSA